MTEKKTFLPYITHPFEESIHVIEEKNPTLENGARHWMTSEVTP